MNGNGNGNGHNGNGNGHTGSPFDHAPDFDDDFEPQVPDDHDTKTWKFDFFPTVSWWLDRELPEPDFLLGGLISTTTRMMLVGPTGRGKTSFALALSLSIALGHDFLHWECPRAARVLLIDGEMANGATQSRIKDEVQRQEQSSNPLLDNLLVMNREDYPDMPPLNTPEGQQFIDQFLQFIGPVDLIVFDNLQALLIGDMKDTEQWSKLLPWVRANSQRKIGQIWIHHSNDDGKSYGDKSREWQLDTVAMMEGVELNTSDICFDLSFGKARDKYKHRSDFEPARITLENNLWNSSRGGVDRHHPRRVEDLALAALDEALEKAGQEVHAHPNIANGTICVDRDLWFRYFEMRYVGTDNPKTMQNRFGEIAKKLTLANVTGYSKPFVFRAHR
jgi:hypothetical protein